MLVAFEVTRVLQRQSVGIEVPDDHMVVFATRGHLEAVGGELAVPHLLGVHLQHLHGLAREVAFRALVVLGEIRVVEWVVEGAARGPDLERVPEASVGLKFARLVHQGHETAGREHDGGRQEGLQSVEQLLTGIGG